jgi:hypothetical protein
MATVLLDPIRVFDESFPRDFQEDLVRMLRRLYRDSLSVSRSLASEPHARDLHPQLRRAQIESKLGELAAMHPKLSFRVVKNRSNNSHVVVEGEHIIMTESYSRSPRKFIRWAAYRAADSMNNYPLFRGAESGDELAPGMKFNAILLHGYGPRADDTLGFALVRFPKPEAKTYLDDVINLLERFPETSAPPAAHAMEVIPDTIEPKIRIDQPIRHDS